MIDIKMTNSGALLARGRYALTPSFLNTAKLSSEKSYNNKKYALDYLKKLLKRVILFLKLLFNINTQTKICKYQKQKLNLTVYIQF